MRAAGHGRGRHLGRAAGGRAGWLAGGRAGGPAGRQAAPAPVIDRRPGAVYIWRQGPGPKVARLIQ